MVKMERSPAEIIVVDRGQVHDSLGAAVAECEAEISLAQFGSVLEVLGENGPKRASGLVVSVGAAGPFLQDLLRWTEPDSGDRIPTAVVGTEEEGSAVDLLLGHDHVRWVDSKRAQKELLRFLRICAEVNDLRGFRFQHDDLAQKVRDARTRLFSGELGTFVPPEGPPCGPPLPTSIEEINSLKDARAQFERGLIRAAVREAGSLKDASAALGISYTSLWRRMR